MRRLTYHSGHLKSFATSVPKIFRQKSYIFTADPVFQSRMTHHSISIWSDPTHVSRPCQFHDQGPTLVIPDTLCCTPDLAVSLRLPRDFASCQRSGCRSFAIISPRSPLLILCILSRIQICHMVISYSMTPTIIPNDMDHLPSCPRSLWLSIQNDCQARSDRFHQQPDTHLQDRVRTQSLAIPNRS